MTGQLVTGNRGFIGGRLFEYLHTFSDDTFGLDMLKEYPTTDSLRRFLIEHDIKQIYHLGARPFIPDCFGSAIEDVVESNVSFTATLLNAAHMAGVERILYLSTSEVYGNSPTYPIGERTPVNPISTYSVTKYAAESLCRSFAVETGMDIRVMRQFNVYGPRDTHPRIIPKLMKAAKYGESIKLGTLSVTRDFSYVDDVVLAIIRVMEHKKRIPLIVHGSGRETSIHELIDMIENLYGKKINYELDEKQTRPAEVYRLVANVTEYCKLFGSHHKMTLEDGIAKTKNWYETEYWSWDVNGK